MNAHRKNRSSRLENRFAIAALAAALTAFGMLAGSQVESARQAQSQALQYPGEVHDLTDKQVVPADALHGVADEHVLEVVGSAAEARALALTLADKNVVEVIGSAAEARALALTLADKNVVEVIGSAAEARALALVDDHVMELDCLSLEAELRAEEVPQERLLAFVPLWDRDGNVCIL